MLKSLRSLVASICQTLAAFYLGHVVWDIFLRLFLPTAWTIPGTLLCAIALFFVLRWLRTETVFETGRASSDATSPLLTAPSGFLLWRTFAVSHLLRSRAFTELSELLNPSPVNRNGSGDPATKCGRCIPR